MLDTATQETDETPAFDTRRSAGTVIQVRADRVDEAHLPVSSHLDFDSANGVYYWEAFFHAPLLIAQALNAAQRFAEAKQWYEYVFDPTPRPGQLAVPAVPRRRRRRARRHLHARRSACSAARSTAGALAQLARLLDKRRDRSARCSRRSARSADDEAAVLARRPAAARS